MSEMSRRIVELPDDKRRLLEWYLKKEGVNHSRSVILPRGRETDTFPLSFAQQRLWFIHQLDPDSPLYNIPEMTRLDGRLDVDALRRSVCEIVRRHESLRTSFTTKGGEPVQIISPPSPVPLPVTDLTHLPEAEREAEAQRIGGEEARRPFDIQRAPLLRVRLLRLGPEQHVLLVNMHHIVSDGWSINVFTDELTRLYEAYAEGRASPLEELPIQYADYAAWQREYLAGAELERQLSYWRGKLGGELPTLELPTDRPRPTVLSTRGGAQDQTLSPSLSEQLRELSRREGATLFMTLLAAFKVLLSRYTSQTDIAVGTPIAGRTRAELEPLIGFFVNTLVLRTDLSGGPTFRELMGRVKETALGAFEHQDVPFEKLVDELRPQRDLSRTPLFQVLFTFQSASDEEPSPAGLDWEPLETETTKFDLSLSMAEADGRLAGALVYSAELFESVTIRRMLSHFARLLEGAARDPDAPISALPLMSEEERRQVLVEWNDTRREYPRGECVHELFEAQAALTPEAVAVVCGRERVSYRELDERANRVAHRLKELGVRAESLVGVCLGRSTELVAGLLGVLKAGAAYVPLDPLYPRERLALMLENSRARVLLTEQHLRAALPQTDARVLCLDEECSDGAPARAENPRAEVAGENLAYVIYTSGSTGVPKGVAITHRSASTLLHWAFETFAPEHLRGVLASTSVCFDLSVYELFVPLGCGGQIILAENALALPTLEARDDVTLVNTVPSAMAELVRSRGVPEGVRVVNLAGEPLPAKLVEEVYSLPHVREVVNLYGPTEDTTYSTVEKVKRGEGRAPTIGRPVANTCAYVLDEALRPVPVGVNGELYLSGEGLARGYLNLPDLTAERFIPDPFSPAGGARMYRTGDLARYLSDGRIEFLGRADHQVKIRGFRIELGEIETLLTRQRGVREAAVLARYEESGAKRLVAYFAPEPGEAVSAGELRRGLREKLPEHMVPSAFVRLEALPLTPNGKLDRRALASLDGDRAEREGARVAPRDALEFQLAQIWEELLNVPQVGVGENFFDLGGHSLLTVRLVAQLQQRLGYSVPLATVLQAQTVEELSKVLRRQTAGRHSSPLVAIQPRGTKPPFFCVHPVGGGVLCYTSLARRLGAEQPFYGLQAPGLDEETEPHARIEDLASAYVEALRGARPEGPYALGGWSMGGVVAFEMARQLRLQNQQVSLLALLDSQLPAAANRNAAADEVSMLLQFAWNLEQMLGVELPFDEEELRGRAGEEERLRLVLEAACESLPGAEMGRLRRLFRVFKANVEAMLSYEPREYPGRVTLFRAEERPAPPGQGWDGGWREFAAGGVELHLVPGDHYTFIKEPHVRVLAERLGACLGESAASGEGRASCGELSVAT